MINAEQFNEFTPIPYELYLYLHNHIESQFVWRERFTFPKHDGKVKITIGKNRLQPFFNNAHYLTEIIFHCNLCKTDFIYKNPYSHAPPNEELFATILTHLKKHHRKDFRRLYLNEPSTK